MQKKQSEVYPSIESNFSDEIKRNQQKNHEKNVPKHSQKEAIIDLEKESNNVPNSKVIRHKKITDTAQNFEYEHSKKKRKLNMNEYLNEKSLTIKPSKTNVKNSKAFVGMPPSQKKHHSGSIKIKFIECHIERSKTKLIRRRTLFKKVFKN